MGRLRDAWHALRGYAAAQDSRASSWAASGGYTDADQQAEYPGDRFFEFVPALQEAEIRLPIQ